MDPTKIPAMADTPSDINVIIEIPANAAPIKYEQDKHSGALWVDRFVSTCMFYPLNYGYIPQTLAQDGDPLDALVYTPYPLLPACVVCCRMLGVLNMEDEAGLDTKLIAVPINKVCLTTGAIQSIDDLPILLRKQIQHFFEHYKDLEKNKWVKVQGWGSVEAAHDALRHAMVRFQNI